MKKIVIGFIVLIICFSFSCKTSEEIPDVPTPTKYSPTINSFTADKMTVEVGESTTLRWNVSNALQVTLTSNYNTPEVVPLIGSLEVHPTPAHSTYSLKAIGNGGSTTQVEKKIIIQVNVPPPPPPPPASPSVEYRISGSAYSVFITYENKTEGISQEYANVPWTYSWSGAKSGQFLYVSAQNQWETGSVTVEIYKNGSLYKTSTSTGAYVIATASGSY